jgi:urease accessory protein
LTPLLSLLHLSDSLFPIGSFGYSDGLESAVEAGFISSAVDLAAWLEACRDEAFGRTDGPAIVLTWKAWLDADWCALATLDREVAALRPSSAARLSSRAMGGRLLKTWQRLHPDTRLAQLVELSEGGRIGPALPVAFAVACAASGVTLKDALGACAYTRLAATVSAAMRLVSIGQHEAHGLLSAALAGVPPIVENVLAREAPPSSFTPAFDIAQMTQPYVRSRLFRS